MKLDMNCRIMERLRLMRQHSVLCDLEVFSNDGVKRRIHSCVWVAAFEECRNLLSNKYKGCGNKLSKIKLSKVNSDMLSTIIDFIYGEEISSIPVGLDGALKELGFQDFKYYLNSGLSDYMCNQRSPENCSANDNDKLKIQQISESISTNLYPDSHHDENLQLKDEIVEANTVNSALPSCTQNDIQQTIESTENYMSSVHVKLEPVESMEDTWNTSEQTNDQMGNIQIFSKQEADDQTVTVCVKYDCAMNSDDGEELTCEKQSQCQPSISAGKSVEKDKEILNDLMKEVPIPQQSNAVYIASNSLPIMKPSTTSESGQIAKNPPILPKFSSNQGDIVTVATFLSFAELQKQGKSWKLQENLVPIPMSGNSVDTFNKLPIFPQNSQSKCVGEKKSRGRPKVPETEKVKVSNKSQKKSTVNKGPRNSTPKAATVNHNKVNLDAKTSTSFTAVGQNNVLLTSSCSTSTTHSVQVPMVMQSQNITKCTSVINNRTVVTSNVQPKLPIPMNHSSAPTPVRIGQPGNGIFHTMIPCVDFNDSIPIGCIHSVAPRIHSNLLLAPKSSISECIPQQSLASKDSKQGIGGNTLFSIPTSNQYIITGNSGQVTQVFPASSMPITSTLQPNLLNTVSAPKPSIKQKAMGKSLSAPILPKNYSPVNVHKSVQTYREIKPKLRNPSFIASNADNTKSKDRELRNPEHGNKSLELPKSPNQRSKQPETINHEDAKPMRKPRKRTRSLQNNKTLLNEPLDKYILDNVKKTKRNVSSTLKIKMNAINPQSRFMKRKNPKDMVAELFKNSTVAEFQSTPKKT